MRIGGPAFHALIDVLLLTLLGAVALGALAGHVESFGWAFVLGLPTTIGFIVGHNVNDSATVAWIAAALVTLGAVVAMFFLGIVGILCGGIAGVALLPFALVGTALGSAVRRLFPEVRRGRTAYLLLFASAGAIYGEPFLVGAQSPETVKTTLVLDTSREDAWHALTFYEDVPSTPPLLARYALPVPIGTHGSSDHVGAETECEYATGRLRKLVTRLQRGSLLEFDVIEQIGIEDRSVELLSGSFRFEATSPETTRVTLTTTYRPKLTARMAWRPFERAVCRSLHLHVLREIERAAEGAACDAPLHVD